MTTPRGPLAAPDETGDPTRLRGLVAEKARELGFDAVAVARADEPLGLAYERYRAFVADGLHGSMGYLAAEPEARARLDGEAILPGAKSVICLARRYQRRAGEERDDPPMAQRIARYARGHDYHNHLRKKLRLLAKFLRRFGPDVRARPLCDEEPILERAWAARAGLGFVGKNGLLIVPGEGSFVLLGEVVTTLAIAPDTALPERCGACTRCLDACPTQAFRAPFVLDPRRCVAYLTIEAPLEARSAELEAAIGERLFGCDDCQTVCPFNRTEVGAETRNGPFAPLPIFAEASFARLAALREEELAAWAEGSPLRRAGAAGLARSVVTVARAVLAQPAGADAAAVRADAEAALAVARAHPDPRVRRAAARPGTNAGTAPESGEDAMVYSATPPSPGRPR